MGAPTPHTSLSVPKPDYPVVLILYKPRCEPVRCWPGLTAGSLQTVISQNPIERHSGLKTGSSERSRVPESLDCFARPNNETSTASVFSRDDHSAVTGTLLKSLSSRTLKPSRGMRSLDDQKPYPAVVSRIAVGTAAVKVNGAITWRRSRQQPLRNAPDDPLLLARYRATGEGTREPPSAGMDVRQLASQFNRHAFGSLAGNVQTSAPILDRFLSPR